MFKNISNQNLIAINTLMLYIRMALVMVATLYISRIVLQALGFVDYGIYNVVGGVVSMLGFINSSLSGATSRFLMVEIAKGNKESVNNVFRCSITIHILLTIIILILLETIGLWFLQNKLVIPNDRHEAAFWIFQISTLTILLSIIMAPYNSLIIAYEKMSVYAYFSILEVAFKVIIAVIINNLTQTDKLIMYSFLLLLSQILISIIYFLYCKRHIGIYSCSLLWSKTTSKEILLYSGWTLNGNLAVIGLSQGINILLNLSFGPIVNTARGIALQIQSAVNQFAINFQTAVRPQVIMSYTNGNIEYMHNLMLKSSKFTFYLILLIVAPLFINIDLVLELWLKDYPLDTSVFSRIMLLSSINFSLSMPLLMAIHATGDLKKFQIIEGTVLLLSLPISYISLHYFKATSTQILCICLLVEIVTQICRIYIVCPKINLEKKIYFHQVILPIIKVLTIFVLCIICLYNSFKAFTLLEFFLSSIIIDFILLFSIVIVGMSKTEKIYIIKRLKIIFKYIF